MTILDFVCACRYLAITHILGQIFGWSSHLLQFHLLLVMYFSFFVALWSASNSSRTTPERVCGCRPEPEPPRQSLMTPHPTWLPKCYLDLAKVKPDLSLGRACFWISFFLSDRMCSDFRLILGSAYVYWWVGCYWFSRINLTKTGVTVLFSGRKAETQSVTINKYRDKI